MRLRSSGSFCPAIARPRVTFPHHTTPPTEFTPTPLSRWRPLPLCAPSRPSTVASTRSRTWPWPTSGAFSVREKVPTSAGSRFCAPLGTRDRIRRCRNAPRASRDRSRVGPSRALRVRRARDVSNRSRNRRDPRLRSLRAALTRAPASAVSADTRSRLEIELAQVEMPGLMSMIKEFGPAQPLKGANISGSLHMPIPTAVLLETLVALGAVVRWCSCNICSTQDHAAAAVARDSAAVFAWKGETLEEYWWCTDKMLNWGSELSTSSSTTAVTPPSSSTVRIPAPRATARDPAFPDVVHRATRAPQVLGVKRRSRISAKWRRFRGPPSAASRSRAPASAKSIPSRAPRPRVDAASAVARSRASARAVPDPSLVPPSPHATRCFAPVAVTDRNNAQKRNASRNRHPVRRANVSRTSRGAAATDRPLVPSPLPSPSFTQRVTRRRSSSPSPARFPTPPRRTTRR